MSSTHFSAEYSRTTKQLVKQEVDFLAKWTDLSKCLLGIQVENILHCVLMLLAM